MSLFFKKKIKWGEKKTIHPVKHKQKQQQQKKPEVKHKKHNVRCKEKVLTLQIKT